MSLASGLAYEPYSTGGREEWLMRIGSAEARPILLLAPLFEEMNRSRAFLASIMRDLAGRGFGCWLPDLPGAGESAMGLENCSWSDWRQAAHDAAMRTGGAPSVVSFRGGALLDDAVSASGYWRFAPAEGASLARDMIRASLLKAEEMKGPEVNLSGYRIGDRLLAELSDARPAMLERLRTVRLGSDRNEADFKVEGPALWRRSEPANAPELAERLAADIAAWVERCAAS